MRTQFWCLELRLSPRLHAGSDAYPGRVFVVSWRRSLRVNDSVATSGLKTGMMVRFRGGESRDANRGISHGGMATTGDAQLRNRSGGAASVHTARRGTRHVE